MNSTNVNHNHCNYYFLIGGLFLGYLVYRIIHSVLGDSTFMQTEYSVRGHTWRSIDCNKSIPYNIYCTICSKLMLPLVGLFCECCAVSACKKCHRMIDKKFRCKQITWPIEKTFLHLWVNVGTASKHHVDQSEEGENLNKYFCSWCQRTRVSQENLLINTEPCDFQKYKNIIIPPSNVQVEKGKIVNIKPVPNDDWEPLIIFANRKSGSNRSDEVLSIFRGVLNPLQVIDISATSPERAVRWLPGRCRVLVAGGDGTVAWVLNALHSAPHVKASVGILPMGTGNDLARALGWGASCSDLDAHSIITSLKQADVQIIDRWKITIKPKHSRLGRLRRSRVLYAYNYASIGVDAQVALDFHRARSQFLYRYASRYLNYIAYALLGVGRALDDGGCGGLERRLRVQAGARTLQLPPLQALVVLNIPSWGAGVDLWSLGSEDEVGDQHMDDGKLEVVGISSSIHIARLQCGLAEPYRFAQASHVWVAVRVRPLRADEGSRIVHVVSDKMLVLEEEADIRRDVLRQRRLNDKHYVYDRVFGEESTQEEVYEAVCAPLVGDTLNGIAGAIFAYGATGAGKTHTMTGLMSRALNHLFSSIAESDIPDAYEVKMSYIEIYNEIIRDLLNPSLGPLELRDEGGSGAPVVAGLSEVRANDAAHVAELLARGDRARTAEATHANQQSSRGHALLSVSVSKTVSKGVQRGRLFLIDLAGSERAGLRARRLEGAHINRSLLALGNCIMALSGGARYVNYRDSKLTRLLREVLGGRCRTAMVAHVSPAAAHRDTTRSTLHYAQRASAITNKVERELIETPMHLSQYRTVINELREEIARLKTKMKDDRSRNREEQQTIDENITKEESQEKTAHLKSLREAIVSTFKQQMRLRRRLMELDSTLLGLALDAERQHATISHWEARFNRLYKPISFTGARLSTQQSYRGGTGSVSSVGSERAEAEIAVEQAWAELAAIEREQEAARSERHRVERQLEQVRLRGAQLEQELPAHIESGPEREVLALVCRVHELEADKLALQGERAARAHELRRRDLALQRRDAQRRLTDEIITRQRRALEELGVGVQPDLSQLYELYQQEIHASTYTESNEYSPYRLPPISSSVSEITWSESSSGSGRGSSSGSGGTLALDHHLPLLAPTPRPRTRYSHASAATLKRYSSDDSLVITAPRGTDRAAP